MAGERANHTLQPTALVHEAYMRMVDVSRIDWRGKTHFFAMAATQMRRILVDHARKKSRLKHGGGFRRVALDESLALSAGKDEDLLVVDDALTRLAEIDERQARIVELRFFGGMTIDEAAHVLEVSSQTVALDWRMARAWLRQRLMT